jgi:hypothetical protein
MNFKSKVSIKYVKRKNLKLLWQKSIEGELLVLINYELIKEMIFFFQIVYFIKISDIPNFDAYNIF